MLVNKNNLENSFPIFIRDVLRYNLIDTQSPNRNPEDWIFKGSVTNIYNPPMVFTGNVNLNSESNNIINNKILKKDLNLTIYVWANKMEDRDNITSQVESIITNQNSSDGTNSILSQGVIFKNLSIALIDSLTSKRMTEPNKIRRVAEINTVWRYIK